MVLCFLWCILFPALFLSIMWKCFHSRDLKIEGQSLSTQHTVQTPWWCSVHFLVVMALLYVCSQRVLSRVNWILEFFTMQKLATQHKLRILLFANHLSKSKSTAFYKYSVFWNTYLSSTVLPLNLKLQLFFKHWASIVARPE